MTAGALVAVVAAVILILGVRDHERRRVARLAERLELPYGESDVALAEVRQSQLARATALLSADRRDTRSPSTRPARLSAAMLVVVVGVVVGLTVGLALDQPVLGSAAAAAVPLVWAASARRRGRVQRSKLLEQIPQAMAVLATSLESGAPLERSLVLVADRSDPPLDIELQRLVAEIDLGADPGEAIEHMAIRLDIEDLRWWAFALRIQAGVGGPLAPLTRSLAQVMSQRADLRREAQVLTAEGRLSAYVLGALPLLLMIAIQVTNPSYLEPFFQGWGLLWIGLMAGSILLGIQIILRMVRGPAST